MIESVPTGLPDRRNHHHARPAAVHAGSSPLHGSDAGILLPATDKTLVAGYPGSTVGYPGGAPPLTGSSPLPWARICS